jgi:hypothetical protein
MADLMRTLSLFPALARNGRPYRRASASKRIIERLAILPAKPCSVERAAKDPKAVVTAAGECASFKFGNDARPCGQARVS